MRNGKIIDALTSIDIQELLKPRGKMIEIYEGVNYGENFQTSPLRKVLQKLFALGQKIKTKETI